MTILGLTPTLGVDSRLRSLTGNRIRVVLRNVSELISRDFRSIVKKHAIVLIERFFHVFSHERREGVSRSSSSACSRSFRKLAEFLRPAGKAYLLLSKPILPPGFLARWIARCYGDFPTDTKRRRRSRRNREKKNSNCRTAYKSAAFVRCVSFELVLQFVGFFFYRYIMTNCCWGAALGRLSDE